jgi:aryl-alcohol dehydrogenase-like predicted oxidoreductase
LLDIFLGLLAMTMAGVYTSEGALDHDESIRAIHRALDLGVTHIDTAEIYGPFLSEEIIGRALKGRRDYAKIATKFGIVSHAGGGPGVNDSTAANIKTAVEGSLKRLDTDHIDLCYQHRVDRNTPIEETAGAVAELIKQGNVLHFGLSEASPETIRRAHAVQPGQRRWRVEGWLRGEVCAGGRRSVMLGCGPGCADHCMSVLASSLSAVIGVSMALRSWSEAMRTTGSPPGV